MAVNVKLLSPGSITHQLAVLDSGCLFPRGPN